MWTVAWELYHNFPTLRRMLLGAGRQGPAPERGPVAKTSPKPSPRTSPRGSRGNSREPASRETADSLQSMSSAASRRQTKRHIVLVMPLGVLASLNSLLLVGQLYCDGRDAGLCSQAMPVFQPTAHVNRTLRFVLFLSLVQWVQAFSGLFPHWATALTKASGWLPRLVSSIVVVLLLPASFLRLFLWLSKPAGSGVVRWTLGGLVRHHLADSVLVTCWSWWSLLITLVVQRPDVIRCSGFTLRSVSSETSWRHLCCLFKYTLFFWMGVHWIRGCVAYGPAHAQSDLISISMFYPLLLCLIWTVTFLAVALSGIFTGFWRPLLAFFAGSGPLLGLAVLLCSWVERAHLPLVVIPTWLHLCRRSFHIARRWGRSWLRHPDPQFAVKPSSHKLLKTTYNVERRLGRIAARVLILICISFLLILSGFVLMAGIQQRSGLFFEDVVWWEALEDGVEITNAGASVLTLRTRNSSEVASAVEAAQGAVLSPGEIPNYAVCGHTWSGLQLVDYALLSAIAYMNPTEKNGLPKLLELLFPHLDVSLENLPETPLGRRWLEFKVNTCKDGPERQQSSSSGCRQLTVVSVSGTDITRVADYAENVRMWTEPVAMQILSTVFPTVRIWPRDCVAMVIRAIHQVLGALALDDDQWHYREILEYVRQIPSEEEVVLTGHSLGGGIALVVGALTGRLAVALQPPGVYHSIAKHQAQQRSGLGGHALHKRSVSLIFEGDWIQNFDGHGGLVQTMMCDKLDKSIAVGCHLLEGAVCQYLWNCGDRAGRFAQCRHEYQPTSTALSVVSNLWDFVKVSWKSSYVYANLQPVMAMGITVSLLAVARHGALPAFPAPREGA
eukprot:TRINITY_DN23872_c1_g1_i1.p1 TRINITY_DN23872_c1_g1~~TRINITY_DN23872_c1_g1_i1.p1  ORF type:complete len:962 (-),score=132.56 TRINITY_DN23872_c1_g1_i1:94-2613(-)